jgi:hypothetical protein
MMLTLHVDAVTVFHCLDESESVFRPTIRQMAKKAPARYATTKRIVPRIAVMPSLRFSNYTQAVLWFIVKFRHSSCRYVSLLLPKIPISCIRTVIYPHFNALR